MLDSMLHTRWRGTLTARSGELYFHITIQLTWELQKIQTHNFTVVPRKPFVRLPAASHWSPVPQMTGTTCVTSAGPGVS